MRVAAPAPSLVGDLDGLTVLLFKSSIQFNSKLYNLHMYVCQLAW